MKGGFSPALIQVAKMKETINGIYNGVACVGDIIKQAAPSTVFVLVDENTLKYCYPLVIQYLPQHQVISIKSGEEHKVLETCTDIWNQLTKTNADRQTILINLGGGVIGDMGGFAAGCYKRGVRFINIPTTLLAMVDASVGAKTGIDFNGFKNQIGLFNQPLAVVVDTVFLKTLPERELLSGFAEVLKHYLISDKEQFEWVITNKPVLSNLNWAEVVTRNIVIKSNIVKQDPTEQGIRKALNYGHTIGHAVESMFLNDEQQSLLHGEAVAIGLITEAFISGKVGLLNDVQLNEVAEVVLHYFKLPYLPQQQYAAIINLLKQDKKNEGGETKFTLLNPVGNYSINNSVQDDLIIQSLNYYNNLLDERR